MLRSLAHSFSLLPRHLTRFASLRTAPLATQTRSSPSVAKPKKQETLSPQDEHLPRAGERLLAVTQVGGHQFKVTPGDLIIVDQIDADIGEKILLQKVLVVASKSFTLLGRPIIADATVAAEVEEHVRAEKKTIYKMRRRKHSARLRNFRAELTALRITGINVALPSPAELQELPFGPEAIHQIVKQQIAEAKAKAMAPIVLPTN